MDGKDENGLKLEKVRPTFSSFKRLSQQKILLWAARFDTVH